MSRFEVLLSVGPREFLLKPRRGGAYRGDDLQLHAACRGAGSGAGPALVFRPFLVVRSAEAADQVSQLLVSWARLWPGGGLLHHGRIAGSLGPSG